MDDEQGFTVFAVACMHSLLATDRGREAMSLVCQAEPADVTQGTDCARAYDWIAHELGNHWDSSQLSADARGLHEWVDEFADWFIVHAHANKGAPYA